MSRSWQKATSFLRPRLFCWGDVTGIGVLASAATLLGFCGGWWWLADLCAHFRVQYFLVLTVVALLLLIPRRWKTAGGFSLAAILNLATILPLYFGHSSPVATEAVPLRAMLLNVNRELGDTARVADAIADFDPDILVLEEVNDRWIEELDPSLAAFAYRIEEPMPNNFGIALYSKLPLGSAEIVNFGVPEVPSIVARIETDSGPVTVIATHPVPPYGGQVSRLRDAQLAKLPERVHAATGPVMLLGDLNTTPWGAHFKRLLKNSGLRDSSRGYGVQATWPAQSPLLWIPIDHCLHSAEIHVVHRQTGPNVGSDHYPLIVDFSIEM